jgi:nonsense-mediated mRNA decay protein 3
LEQLLLKHNAHSECLNIMTFKDGMDFYFGEQQQANRFVDFLSSHVPVKTKYARKLLSADHSANVGKFRHNHLVEIAPLCKDDLVLMPTKLAANLSNISPLALVKAISAGIHVVDPLTGDRQEIDMEKYWRHEFPCKMTGKELVPFIVLSVEPLLGASAALRPSAKKRGFDKKVRLAECVVAREKDFGVNDMQYTCVTHLGNILKEGDTVMGYDLAGAAWANERETQDFLQTHGLLRATGLPDVVLVRKKYASKSDRFWELRSLEMETGVVEAGESNGKYDGAAAEKDYELFLQELEADKEMRANVNLYKAQGGRGKKGMEVEADEMDGGLGADAISKAKSRKGRSKLRRAKMDAIADEEKKAREKAHAEENMDDSDAENANNDYDDDEEGVRLDELLDEMTLSAGDAANAEVEAPVVISQEQAAQSAALQLETSGFDPADFAAKPFKFT